MNTTSDRWTWANRMLGQFGGLLYATIWAACSSWLLYNQWFGWCTLQTSSEVYFIICFDIWTSIFILVVIVPVFLMLYTPSFFRDLFYHKLWYFNQHLYLSCYTHNVSAVILSGLLQGLSIDSVTVIGFFKHTFTE